jgi:hypothetical protein
VHIESTRTTFDHSPLNLMKFSLPLSLSSLVSLRSPLSFPTRSSKTGVLTLPTSRVPSCLSLRAIQSKSQRHSRSFAHEDGHNSQIVSHLAPPIHYGSVFGQVAVLWSRTQRARFARQTKADQSFSPSYLLHVLFHSAPPCAETRCFLFSSMMRLPGRE